MPKTPTTPKNWRLQEQIRSGGRTYYAVVRGSRADRVSLSVGYVTTDEAARAVAAMQREEDETAGTARYDRVFSLWRDGDDEIKAQVVRRLVSADHDALVAMLGPEPVRHERLALREYWEAVFWPVRTRGEPGLPPVAAATQRGEKGYWKQINEALGDVALGDLDAWTWEDYVSSMAQHPRTKALHRSAYKALVDYAHRKRHLEEVHPFFQIKGSTSRARAKVAPLTMAEVARLLTVAENGAPGFPGSPMRRVQWAIGVGQGLRPSELCRCEVQDFDLVDQVMIVRGDPERDGKGKTAESATVIPLTPFTARELRRFIDATGQTEGPMFRWHGRQITEFKRALAGHAEAAGIVRTEKRKDKETGRIVEVERAVTPYVLRHSFATLCWNLGIDKEVTRRIGRWTTDDMLDEVYCRPSPRDLVARLKRFDFDIDALSQDPQPGAPAAGTHARRVGTGAPR